MSYYYKKGNVKSSASQFTPDKWRHFPHNLLKSYGAPDLKTEDDEYLQVLKPYNTEYFTRPTMGLSMLSQTVADGMTVVNSYKDSVFSKQTVKLLSKGINKIEGSLAKLDNKNKEAGNAERGDVKKVVKWAISEDETFDQVLDEAIHASSAMLTLASQIKGVRVLFRNPKEYAEKASSQDGSHKKFQKKGKLPEMVEWISSALRKTKKTSRKSLREQFKSMKSKRQRVSSSSEESKSSRKRNSSSDSEVSQPAKKRKTTTSKKYTVSSSEETQESWSSSSSDEKKRSKSAKYTTKSAEKSLPKRVSTIGNTSSKSPLKVVTNSSNSSEISDSEEEPKDVATAVPKRKETIQESTGTVNKATTSKSATQQKSGVQATTHETTSTTSSDTSDEPVTKNVPPMTKSKVTTGVKAPLKKKVLPKKK